MNWFGDVSELVDTLFVGSHIGPGGVPRGTEVQTLSYENVKESVRGLHVMHGYLTTVLRYNKTRHNVQKDKFVARFFPPRLGRLFLYYLAIIRPLEKIWAADVFGVEKSYGYRHLVFVRYAKPMQTPQFSKALYDSSLNHINIGLGIHDYRHLIKAILRIVLSIDYDNDEEDDTGVEDASFGHSRAIGATYGLSYNDLPNLPSDLLLTHQRYCERVHQWLGEGRLLSEHDNPLISSIKAAIIDAVKAEIPRILIPAIRDTVNSEISTTLSNMPWPYLMGTDTRVPVDRHICDIPVVVQPSTVCSRQPLSPSTLPSTSVASHGHLPMLPTPPVGWKFNPDRTAMIPMSDVMEEFMPSSSSVDNIAPLIYETPAQIQANEKSHQQPHPNCLSRNSLSLAPPSHRPLPSTSRPTALLSHSSSTSYLSDGTNSHSTGPTPRSDGNQVADGLTHYEERAKQLLNFLKNAAPCPLCWFFSDDAFPRRSDWHNDAFKCPRGTMTSSDYGPFRAIKFSRGKFICYRCCEPHGEPFEHPRQSNGCTYVNVIKPIAYAIFRDDRVRAKVFGQMKLKASHFASITDYVAWLGKMQTTPGAMYNIHEVVLVYYKLYPNGGTE